MYEDSKKANFEELPEVDLFHRDLSGRANIKPLMTFQTVPHEHLRKGGP